MAERQPLADQLASARDELRQKELRLWENIMLRYAAQEEAWDEWERRLREGDADGATVRDAVRALGLAALWTRADEPRDYVTAVQDLVRGQIKAWFVAARSDAPIAERRRAAGLLKGLGTTLAGDNRGRGSRRAAHPATVLYSYKRNLLRLRTAVALLDSSRRGASSESLIASVAEACGIEVDRFRRFLGVYADERGRRLKILAEARAWAGTDNRVTEQTVLNLCSRLRSRK